MQGLKLNDVSKRGYWTPQHRRNIHCTPPTRRVPCYQQDTVHGVRRTGKDIWLCTQTCYRVSSSQALCWGVAGTSHSEHVWNSRNSVLAETRGAFQYQKMSSYQYRDFHVKDKTVSPTVLSLTWESPYLGKTVFILRRGLRPSLRLIIWGVGVGVGVGVGGVLSASRALYY